MMVYIPCYDYVIFACITNKMSPDLPFPTESSVCVYLFLVFTSTTVHSQETTTVPFVPKNDTSLLPNSSECALNCTSSFNDALSDEYPSWEAPPDGAFGSSFPHDSKNVNKPLAVHLIQKFSNWVRPFYEKWGRIKDLLGHPNQANYGSVVGPQQVLDKFHEKGHHFLTGINGAVYGLAPLENHDYPFAYRKLSSLREKSE